MTFVDSQLWQRMVAHAAADPQRIAYQPQCGQPALTYRDLVDAAVSFSAASERQALLLPSGNDIQFAPRFFGALLAGRPVLPLPNGTTAGELQRLQQRLDTHEERAEAALLLMTSGTTAVPKIVRRDVASLDAVAAAMVEAIGFGPADRVVASVPLVHSYGIEHGLLAPLWAGSTVVLCDGLDVPRVSSAIESGGTILPTVPSAIELLANMSAPLKTTALRRVYTAGAPLPVNVAARFESRFGTRVGQVYGATEIGSVLYRDPTRDAAGCVGRAMTGVSVRILSTDADRRVLPIGEEGEVAIAAPSMLTNYVGEPTPLIDGHYSTGDIGRLNAQGELTLVGRVRLLIDVGGAKVNPLEVEAVLEAHPAVASAVVLPLRLSETVSKVRAIVVPANNVAPPDVAALRAHVRAYLAAYKVPRIIEFRSSLPRTAAGKIARQQLESTETETAGSDA